MSDEGMSDDGPCTDCDDTGITHQTERVCSCLAGLAIEMIDADACPTPIDLITSLEAQLLAAERERDALREALDSIAVYGDDTLSGPVSEAAYRHWHRDGVRVMRDRARAALTANHSAPVVEG